MSPNEIVEYWLQNQSKWFQKSDAFDDEIRQRFGALVDHGPPASWKDSALGCLALVIVLDQFPRNLFRGQPRSFATDQQALDIAHHAIAEGFDRRLTPTQLSVLYMPFQHSESRDEQRRSLELFATLGGDAMTFAQKHADIIERFGRYPHRNATLGRTSTPEEVEFLKQPGSSF